MDKATILQAFAMSTITGLIGLVFFFGSVHAGGSSFFVGMAFMPFLYLDYKGVISTDSLSITIIMALVAQFIIWLVIIVLVKKIFRIIKNDS